MLFWASLRYGASQATHWLNATRHITNAASRRHRFVLYFFSKP
ncbi:MAG TPA: hypothetical protein PKH93_11265 [Chitinophagales bacterium]|nr:hypothetical protein [Chitinophagales bacterium]